MHCVLKDYIGTKDFYERTARIAVPLALQNLLLSCQSMIDTMMVTRIGMVSAVGTAAQIDSLAGLVSYGVVGGIGMFAAQFYGARDGKNLKRCLGLCLTLVMINAVFWITMASFFGENILRFYMNDDSVVRDGLLYLNIEKWSLIFQGISFSFSNMLRNTKQPKIALYTSVVTACVNVVLNLCLIYGLGPFPEMGVEGAALATVIAQCAGCVLLISYCIHTKQMFLGRVKEMLDLPLSFAKPIFERVWPLILNESTFGVGQTLFVKAFGQLGKEQMDAYYVGLEIYNLLTFLIYGYGSAVQILLGSILGKGEVEEAKKECRMHMGLSLMLSVVLVSLICLLARPMVLLFGLSDESASNLAVRIVYVFAVKASMRLFNFVIFCVLRSGGDAKVIPLLDSGLEWAVGLTSAFFSVNVLKISGIALVLLITQLEQLVRLVFGMKRVRSGRWARDLTVLVE